MSILCFYAIVNSTEFQYFVVLFFATMSNCRWYSDVNLVSCSSAKLTNSGSIL